MAHGYLLLHEFFSPPFLIKIEDNYGSGLYNRCRLLIEII